MAREPLLTGDYSVHLVLVSTTIAQFCSEFRTELLDEGNLRLIVGVTGASGAIYPLRLLNRLSGRSGIEIHLILTRAGEKTLYLETGKRAVDIKSLANYSWPLEDISAPVASGSFQSAGMVISPCSINTMSSIAHGISSNLMIRAADVILKERRPLVLMVRESPFHLGHLRSMTALAEMGAIIAPPVPGFYNHPETIEDLVDSSVDRVLDLLGLSDGLAKRWNGPEHERPISNAKAEPA